MTTTITLQRATFAALLASVFYKPDPNGDDPLDGWPFQRLDPVSRLERILAQNPGRRGINPQPIPPGDGRFSAPGWPATRAMHAQIAHASHQFELASLIVAEGDTRRVAAGIGLRLHALVDELCPPFIRWPLPPPRDPWPWLADLFLAAGLLEHAAQRKGGLQSQFQSAADRMVDAAQLQIEALSKASEASAG